MPSFIKELVVPENPCYRDEISYCQVNYISRRFPKGERDSEYWWLLKENYNNTELRWD